MCWLWKLINNLNRQMAAEKLEFENKMLQLKQQKFNLEYLKKKQSYEEEIAKLKQENESQRQVILKIEPQMENLRAQMNELIKCFGQKEDECLNQQKQLEEKCHEFERATTIIEAQKIRIGDLQQQSENVMWQLGETQKRIESANLSVKKRHQEDLSTARDLLLSFSLLKESRKNDSLSLNELLKICFSVAKQQLESSFNRAIDDLNSKLKSCTNNFKKLKMHFGKLRAEKDFYKNLYQQQKAGIIASSAMLDNIEECRPLQISHLSSVSEQMATIVSSEDHQLDKSTDEALKQADQLVRYRYDKQLLENLNEIVDTKLRVSQVEKQFKELTFSPNIDYI